MGSKRQNRCQWIFIRLRQKIKPVVWTFRVLIRFRRRNGRYEMGHMWFCTARHSPYAPNGKKTVFSKPNYYPVHAPYNLFRPLGYGAPELNRTRSEETNRYSWEWGAIFPVGFAKPSTIRLGHVSLLFIMHTRTSSPFQKDMAATRHGSRNKNLKKKINKNRLLTINRNLYTSPESVATKGKKFLYQPPHD